MTSLTWTLPLPSSVPAPAWRLRRTLPLISLVVRILCAVLIRSYLRTFHRLEIQGRENLPAGRFIMVANHASHLDTLCMLAALPLNRLHEVYPAAAADYFFADPIRQSMAELVVNALPFDRHDNSRDSLALCEGLLQDGNALIYFPEGTRSPTGEMQRFRSGIGRLATATGVPVVPCRLEGCGAVWPKGRLLPRPGKVALRIGEPRSYGENDGVLEIAAELEQRVALPSLS